VQRSSDRAIYAANLKYSGAECILIRFFNHIAAIIPSLDFKGSLEVGASASCQYVLRRSKYYPSSIDNTQ
jgi:hypothetical protein